MALQLILHDSCYFLNKDASGDAVLYHIAVRNHVAWYQVPRFLLNGEMINTKPHIVLCFTTFMSKYMLFDVMSLLPCLALPKYMPGL